MQIGEPPGFTNHKPNKQKGNIQENVNKSHHQFLHKHPMLSVVCWGECQCDCFLMNCTLFEDNLVTPWLFVNSSRHILFLHSVSVTFSSSPDASAILSLRPFIRTAAHVFIFDVLYSLTSKGIIVIEETYLNLSSTQPSHRHFLHWFTRILASLPFATITYSNPEPEHF